VEDHLGLHLRLAQLLLEKGEQGPALLEVELLVEMVVMKN